MIQKLVVDWQDVEYFIRQLAKELPKNISGVYGIPRGGLCLAVMLSHYTKIPLLLAPCPNCLIIDDIADTGLTLLHYKECGYYIATMFYHEQSKVVPDFWYKVKNDEWIVYPWELGG